jgi:hypothetical protein
MTSPQEEKITSLGLGDAESVELRPGKLAEGGCPHMSNFKVNI